MPGPPSGAAALRRLSIEELCVVLGQTKDVRLYEAIGNLIQMGKVNERAQKALDAVRVKGSSLLHPGQIELADTTTIANQRFMLANLIVR